MVWIIQQYISKNSLSTEPRTGGFGWPSSGSAPEVLAGPPELDVTVREAGCERRRRCHGEPQRVCEGCFRAAQEPEKPASSLAHTALVLNTVAGAVTARDLTAAFKERRESLLAERAAKGSKA